VATLVGLAVDAPRLVERIEADAQWVDLKDAAEDAIGGRRQAEGAITDRKRNKACAANSYASTVGRARCPWSDASRRRGPNTDLSRSSRSIIHDLWAAS
jgi:hypothetical protein